MVHRHRFIAVGGRIHYRRHIKGTGMGSILLDKGLGGSASSYDSQEDYHKTTGRGLADTLKHKLNNLVVKPLNRKPKNIKFDL